MLQIINPEFVVKTDKTVPADAPYKRIAGATVNRYEGPATTLARKDGKMPHPILEVYVTDDSDKSILHMESYVTHPRNAQDVEIVRTRFYQQTRRNDDEEDAEVYLMAIPYSGVLDSLQLPDGLHLVDARILSLQKGSVSWRNRNYSRMLLLLIYVEPNAKPCSFGISSVVAASHEHREIGKDKAIYTTLYCNYDENGLSLGSTTSEDVVMPEIKKDIFTRWAPEPRRRPQNKDRQPRNDRGGNGQPFNDRRGDQNHFNDRRTKGTGRGPRQG